MTLEEAIKAGDVDSVCKLVEVMQKQIDLQNKLIGQMDKNSEAKDQQISLLRQTIAKLTNGSIT